MRLYLIRHPRPQQINGICYGRLDVSITSDELHRATACVNSVIPNTVLASSAIYTSPSQRCFALADALATSNTPIISDTLAEIDFGRWEGCAWDNVPRDELDAWATSLMDYRPGGGESARMVLDRWKRFHDSLRSTEDENVIAVTHAGIIRLAYVDGKRIALENMWNVVVDFGSIHVFDW